MSKEPNRNIYVGHRYVPKIMGEWDNQNDYEGLSIVTHQGASYTSKKRVPVGIDILNEEFWVVTGNYNTQVETYRRDVNEYRRDVNEYKEGTDQKIDNYKQETDQKIVNYKQETDQKIDNYKQETTEQVEGFNEYLTMQLAHTIANVKQFGALGDGLTDDTDSINNAINHVSSLGGGVVRIPFSKDPYMIDAVKSIKLQDNITLQIDGYTTLKCIPNAEQSYNIIDVRDVRNVSIVSDGYAYITGDRDEHLGSSGEWGSGVAIRNVENIYMKNIVSMNTWGDGFYINGVVDGVFENLHSDNARRNGFSLISGENLVFNSISADNTNGTNPQAGIDIEPNTPEEKLVNVVFNNPSFKGNARYGIAFYLSFMTEDSTPIDVTINSPRLYGNPLRFMGLEGYNQGLITINDLHSFDAPLDAVVVTSKRLETVEIVLNNPNIQNFGSESERGVVNGINLDNVSDFVTGRTGNVKIFNPRIKSKYTSTRGIRIGDTNVPKKIASDIHIENPLIDVTLAPIHVISNYDNSFVLKFMENIQQKNTEIAYNLKPALNDLVIDMINQSPTNLFIDPDNYDNSEHVTQTIIRSGVGNFDLKFRNQHDNFDEKPVTVYGLSDTPITNIRLNNAMGSIDLVKINVNSFRVKNMIGDWEGYTI